MNWQIIKKVLRGAALCSVMAQIMSAQNSNSGEIRGTVTDTTGAVIPGAAVSVINVATGVAIHTTTNNDGLYDLPTVEPGMYKITFTKPGFRDFVRAGLTIAVGPVASTPTLPPSRCRPRPS